MKKAYLILEDGTVFEGKSVGSEKEIIKALGDMRELEELYTQEELHRAVEVLRYQAAKYKYMFT